MKRLQNKIILITGASSGIGEACASILVQEGAKLILTARRRERLAALAQTLNEAFPASCIYYGLDVKDRTQVESVFKALPADWQSIDILINNAGLALSTDPLQKGDIDHWETMIDTNLKGLLYMTRQVLPLMIAKNSGHIVNIGSVAGQNHYPNGNVYSATKHAVRAISKSLRLDLYGTAIRVTEIAPGAVETEFSVVRWNDKDRADAFYQDFEPLIGADIADAVTYALTRPPHVNISEMTIFPTAQAGCSFIYRDK